MDFQFFVGCDVAKDSFTFCVLQGQSIVAQGQVGNNSKEIQAWVVSLKKQFKKQMNQMVFCMEHTGIYNAILLRVLQKEQLCTCVEAAMNIKLSLGLQRGKNDKVDAQRIATYAMRFTDRLKQWKPRREAVLKLNHFMAARERLIKAKKVIQGSNSDVELFLDPAVAKLIRHCTHGALEGIQADIKRLDLSIEKLIQNDENLQRLVAVTTSVPGIGNVTAWTLIVKTNEFQDYANAKKIACNAGVVPFDHTSGSSIRGKSRVSHRAHKDLKTALHLAAMGAVRTKGFLQDYYNRKVAEGKNKMLVLNAVRNKLVHIAFAVVRDNTMYEKNYQFALEKS